MKRAAPGPGQRSGRGDASADRRVGTKPHNNPTITSARRNPHRGGRVTLHHARGARPSRHVTKANGVSSARRLPQGAGAGVTHAVLIACGMTDPVSAINSAARPSRCIKLTVRLPLNPYKAHSNPIHTMQHSQQNNLCTTQRAPAFDGRRAACDRQATGRAGKDQRMLRDLALHAMQQGTRRRAALILLHVRRS